MKIDT